MAEAENIKSKQTRKKVQSALKGAMNELDQYRQVPDNGLLLFSGNGEHYGIVPPFTVNDTLYRCDSEYYTEGLLAPLEGDAVGLFVLDRRNATAGVVQDGQVRVHRSIESQVRSQHSSGGQSAQRFERSIEKEYEAHLQRAANLFEELRDYNPKAILLGGPGYADLDLLERTDVPNDLAELIESGTSTSYTGEQGLRELVERNQDFLRDLGDRERVDAFKAFKEALATDKPVAYGKERVRHALEVKAVDTLLVTRDHEELVATAKQQGGEAFVFEGRTEAGEQLANVFGGCAAGLRWQIG